MLASSTWLGRMRQFANRFRLARRGATAVEFGMLALPFFGLLCGVIEIGMIYVVATTLEDATDGVARQIRTGQLQTSGSSTAATFVNAVCAQMSWLGSNCG